MEDIRDQIFKRINRNKVTACIYAEMDGVVSGIAAALEEADNIGLVVDYAAKEGDEVFNGDLIMQVCGNPKQICLAEDALLGHISKYSGVATAAQVFVKTAGPNVRVICGAWKKMPSSIKDKLRSAAATGGVQIRMCNEPMIYLDKNYVEMLGGVQKSLMAVAGMSDRKTVIQIKGRYDNGDIVREALTAIDSGADIVFVDTGNIADLKRVTEAIRPKLKELEEHQAYRKVEFAFAGGINLDSIEAIKEAGADIIDVGRSICDAPLLDLRFDVTRVQDNNHSHASYSLLDKHELIIEGITLDGTNLNELAAIVAEEIGVDKEDVLVIDVRDGDVALDILRSNLDPEKFISKEKTILKKLSNLKGVLLSQRARISSNGMLGWIVGDEEDIEQGIEEIKRSRDLGEQLIKNIAKRVIVFPTGIEVERKEIEDTNTPLIIQRFSEAGFNIEKGETLKDDIRLFSTKLYKAAELGYGVCITTGGVGAENKDFSVEAIQMLDKEASTPYIAKFQAGYGRHSKDGIRIGVGRLGLTTYIALPGPNDEVSLCIDTVVKGVSEGWSKEILSGEIARILRTRLKEKIGADMHHHDA